MTDYERFVNSLSEPDPPAGIEPPLRALWHDANGAPGSAMRVAEGDGSHLGLRVRAYLHRKAGRDDDARLWYWRSGAKPWHGSPESEWQDIVRTVLADRVVRDAYS